jgi:Fis family transcriptional regulator, factor for inversion stimulation protein
MNSPDNAVLEAHGDLNSTTLNQPLRHSVKKALENYLHHLDGQKPVNLYDLVLKEIEPTLLKFVMELTNSNQSSAAKLLGLSRTTLRKKLKQYHI